LDEKSCTIAATQLSYYYVATEYVADDVVDSHCSVMVYSRKMPLALVVML